MIYLASTSPRRKALLKKAGIRFRVLRPDYEEEGGLNAPPFRIVQIHAVKKAESCAGKIKNGTLLAADTVVSLGRKIFGKPGNRREAGLMLGSLQGRRQFVYTGVAIFKIRKGRIVKRTVFFDKTEVRLKRLSAKGVQNYFKKVNPLDKAGAYSLQARRPGLVQTVRGSFSNAVGLPIEKVLKRIKSNVARGVRITYTVTDSPLGYLLLAATSKGISAVRFGNDRRKLERELKREFEAAELVENRKSLRQWNQALIDYLAGHKPWPLLPYDVRATAFQRRVWDWLRTTPSGMTYNYSEAARAMGQPTAARAVARACAVNPVALVIPCHRIVPKSGGAGGYRWNPDRKQQLLKLENSMSVPSNQRSPSEGVITYAQRIFQSDCLAF